MCDDNECMSASTSTSAQYHIYVRMGDPDRKPRCFIIGKTDDSNKTEKEYKSRPWESGWCYLSNNGYTIREAERFETEMINICKNHGGKKANLNEYPEMDENWYVFDSFMGYSGAMREFDTYFGYK